MSKGLIDRVLNQVFDAEWQGKHGEKLTERELKLVQLFGRKGKTLRNIYLPKVNGETSEVDVVFISQKGIFVLESKNYSGWIFGDEKSQYWTAMLPNKEKNRFYNPIKQNQAHLKWMREYVGEKIPLFSIVIFSERCELKKIQVESNDIRVIKRDSTYATIRNIWDKNRDVLSEEQIAELYEKLKALTEVDEAIKVAHVDNIKNKYDQRNAQNTAITKTLVSTETKAELLCPRCGGKLIMRTAKSGVHAGNKFYGCSNYPKCRYLQNI